MSTTLQQAPPVPAARAAIDPRSLRGTHGWAPALRLAWRDARRHRVRSALAMVMVGAPVLLASAVATVSATTGVDGAEEVPALLGSADLRFDQAYYPDPDLPGEAVQRVSDALGPGPTVEVRSGTGGATAGGVTVDAAITATDTTSPLIDGLFKLRSGRLPGGTTEVVASPGLLDRLTLDVGDTMELSGQQVTVTGTATQRYQSPADLWALTTPGDLSMLGPAGSVTTTVLASPVTPTSAAQLDELRSLGISVWTRAELVGFPDRARIAQVAGDMVAGDTLIVWVIALTLVVIQLTLLAGPAFAVGVRQQRRTLAQLAATGADGRALRRIVITQAGLLGLVAATAGAVLGTAGALAFMAAARSRWPGSMGPLDVPLLLVIAAVAVAGVAAVLAALVPAVTATRAAVHGAPGSARGSTGYPWRRAVVGAVIFAASAVLLGYSTTPGTRFLVGVAVGLLTLTVGMLLMIPLVVAALLPVGRVLPPVWRLAMRDTARAAGRSVAAVAAVAAATGGLVAVTTFYTSIEARNRAEYRPSFDNGYALVQATTGPYGEVAPGAVAALAGVVDGAVPGVAVRTVGIADQDADYELRPASCPASPRQACDAGGYVTGIAVTTGPVRLLASAEAAGEDLTSFVADGGLVVRRLQLSPDWSGDATRLTAVRRDGGLGSATPGVEVDVRVVEGRLSTWSSAVMSPATADELFGWSPGQLIIGDGTLDRADVDRLTEAVDEAGLGYVQAELGFRGQGWRAYWALAAAALAAVIAGTLAATALTLVDARRERAVVAAVGARPRTARLTAGATAAVIATVGALAGTVLGLVPGIIGARSQTDWAYSTAARAAGAVAPTVAVPWPTIGLLVVVLPVLLGLAVAIAARGPAALEGATGRAAIGPRT